MGITRDLVKFCAQLKYEALPPEVIDRVNYLALDFVGVAARGTLVDSTRVMNTFVRQIAPANEGGVIIGTALRASFHYAALANGTSGHATELDDVNNEASLHPGNAVFPAAIAAAEMAGADGRKFAEGVVAGYDVMVRLGKALDPRAHYGQGFHPTGTCGVFGAAVAAAKILGLNEPQMLNAVGIAGSQAAGSLEFLADGAWTKRMHPGWAAHSGIIAALLGKLDFRGPATILEGRFGFLHGYSPSADEKKISEGLGESYEILRTSIKPHSCCRYKQGPIDGVLQIMRENRLGAGDIEAVKLGILKNGFQVVAAPRELKLNPASVVDAQFSMPFGAAVAILCGRAFLDEYTQEKIQSPAVKEMMKKITCVEDPALDKLYPKKWPASVEIRTRDGKVYSAWIEYPKGDPENALSWEELIAKFRELASPIYPACRLEEIIEETRKMEQQKDLRDWTGKLLVRG